MQHIATGNTAEIYLHNGTITKVYANHSMQTVQREAMNQAYARSLGLSVPAVIEVTEIDGQPALVMDRAAGVPMRDLLYEHPDRVQEYLTQSVVVQREIHSRLAPDLRSMSERLREQITSVHQVSDEQRSRLIAMLNDISEETHLCHGDFHIQNLIVDSDNVSIIDWNDATRGDVRLDVCRSYVLYSGVDTDFAEMYLDEYCRQAGWNRDDVLRWVPVIAGARLSEGIGAEEAQLLIYLMESRLP